MGQRGASPLPAEINARRGTLRPCRENDSAPAPRDLDKWEGSTGSPPRPYGCAAARGRARASPQAEFQYGNIVVTQHNRIIFTQRNCVTLTRTGVIRDRNMSALHTTLLALTL